MTDSLVLIPARKGSKRLPGKNTFVFEGVPMIAWSIRAAQRSTQVTNIIVSTDDEKVAEIAEKEGAKVQWRPEHLAGDHCSMLAVLQFTVEKLRKKGHHIPEFLILLQPTSPLRELGLIDNALTKINETPEADRLIELVSQKLHSGKVVDGFWHSDSPETTRSQDLPEIFYPSGRLFIYRISQTVDVGSESGSKTIVQQAAFNENINIDEQSDIDKLSTVFARNKDKFTYLIKQSA